MFEKMFCINYISFNAVCINFGLIWNSLTSYKYTMMGAFNPVNCDTRKKLIAWKVIQWSKY